VLSLEGGRGGGGISSTAGGGWRSTPKQSQEDAQWPGAAVARQNQSVVLQWRGSPLNYDGGALLWLSVKKMEGKKGNTTSWEGAL
jgi:hypothetical protein